jgi:hypothetical protein
MTPWLPTIIYPAAGVGGHRCWKTAPPSEGQDGSQTRGTVEAEPESGRDGLAQTAQCCGGTGQLAERYRLGGSERA